MQTYYINNEQTFLWACHHNFAANFCGQKLLSQLENNCSSMAHGRPVKLFFGIYQTKLFSYNRMRKQVIGKFYSCTGHDMLKKYIIYHTKIWHKFCLVVWLSAIFSETNRRILSIIKTGLGRVLTKPEFSYHL